MIKRWKRVAAMTAAVLMAFACFAGAKASAAPREATEKLYEAIRKSGGLQSGYDVGNDFAQQWVEWAVVGAARAGLSYDKQDYLEAAKTYVTTELDTVEKQTAAGCSIFYRLTLAVAAAGGNPRNVGGVDLLAAGDLTVGKSYALSEYTGGLMALKAAQGQTPQSKTDLSLDADGMIAELLKLQMADGGFSYDGKSGDIDATAMALQALAPYVGQQRTAEAVDSGILFLSQHQLSEGGYQNSDTVYGDTTYPGVPNACTTAEVLSALVALKIDLLTDSRFIKGGNTVYDGLAAYQLEDGNFVNTLGADSDSYTLGKAMYALGSFAATNPKWGVGQPEDESQRELKDISSGVSIQLPAGLKGVASFQANPITQGDVYEMVKRALEGKVSDFILFDLSLLDERGNVVPLSGNQARVSLPLPEGFDPAKVAVYRVDEDGTAVPIEQVWVENGMIVFVTDHFSLYAIGQTEQQQGISAPNTADGQPVLLLTLLGGFALAGAFYSRRHWGMNQ